MSQNRSSAVMQQRSEPPDSLDDFPTPPWATRAICEFLKGLGFELRKPLAIERMGQDRYGRTLGHVYAGGRAIACTQLAAGSAKYMKRWVNQPRGRVKGECK